MLGVAAVMAHDSFEESATAAYLNEHVVTIMVDLEERPDVDEVIAAGGVQKPLSRNTSESGSASK